uniref:Uncharacterized protein n=1 Tax=Arundo donax TaxID=35708 RepID=A0A0A9MXV8_ARUDO
MPTCSSNLTW